MKQTLTGFINPCCPVVMKNNKQLDKIKYVRKLAGKTLLNTEFVYQHILVQLYVTFKEKVFFLKTSIFNKSGCRIIEQFRFL